MRASLYRIGAPCARAGEWALVPRVRRGDAPLAEACRKSDALEWPGLDGGTQREDKPRRHGSVLGGVEDAGRKS